jgi:8-oxo-dGTP pyrophosphatase MutT (NUDIX family)
MATIPMIAILAHPLLGSDSFHVDHPMRRQGNSGRAETAMKFLCVIVVHPSRLRYTWPHANRFILKEGLSPMKQHGPWTIKTTRSVYKGELMEVFEDEVIKPDGKEGTYSTIRLKDGASVLALDKDGFVYLVKEFRYALGRQDVAVVAGAIDEGEEPIEAARRELREELGIEAADWTTLGRMHHSTSQVDSSTTLFLARQLSFTEKEEDSGEVLETVKMPFIEAVEKALNGQFTHSTSCVLILRAQQHLRKTHE